jgi:hypothetical protein
MAVIGFQDLAPWNSLRYGILVTVPERVQVIHDLNDTTGLTSGQLYIHGKTTYKWNGSALVVTTSGNSDSLTPGEFLFSTTFESTLFTDKGAHQGVAINPNNGDFYTTSGDHAEGDTSNGTHQFTLRRYNSSGVLQTTNDVSGDVPATTTQLNGCKYYNDKLWIGGNAHPPGGGSPPFEGWVFQVNPTTLEIEATHSTQAEECEGGAWRNDSVRGDEFWAVFHTAREVERFNSDFSSSTVFTLPGSYATRTADRYYQDAFWLDDYLICNLHNSGDWPHCADIYYWNGTAFETRGRMPQPLWEGEGTGEIKASQGLDLAASGDYIIWAGRNHTGGENRDPHNIIRSNFVRTRQTANSNYTDSIQALSDLLIYYNFRETTGTTINNQVSASHDGTLSGGNDLTTCGDILGPVHDTDARGVALTDPDYISVPNDAALSLTGDFSFGCIIYVFDESPSNQWIFSKGDTGDDLSSDHNYALLLNNPGFSGKIGFFMEDTSLTNRFAASTTDLAPGTFYRVIGNHYATPSPNKLELYINGTLEGTNTTAFTVNTNSHPITFNGIAGPGSLGSCHVYDFWLRDDVTSSAEVAALESAFLGL